VGFQGVGPPPPSDDGSSGNQTKRSDHVRGRRKTRHQDRRDLSDPQRRGIFDCSPGLHRGVRGDPASRAPTGSRTKAPTRRGSVCRAAKIADSSRERTMSMPRTLDGPPPLNVAEAVSSIAAVEHHGFGDFPVDAPSDRFGNRTTTNAGYRGVLQPLLSRRPLPRLPSPVPDQPGWLCQPDDLSTINYSWSRRRFRSDSPARPSRRW